MGEHLVSMIILLYVHAQQAYDYSFPRISSAQLRKIPTAFCHDAQMQWRTLKIFMGGVSFSGIWWLFVFGVRCF